MGLTDALSDANISAVAVGMMLPSDVDNGVGALLERDRGH
jgi:hypothetical protein